MKAVCLKNCYWDLRLWKEGEVYEGDRVPPAAHFSGGKNAAVVVKTPTPPNADPPKQPDIFG